MSSQLKPIKLWGGRGPNIPKVSIILEELGLTYTTENVDHADVKKPEYLAINPNGRLPAIHDPNTDLTIWESGAIIEYLIDRYDTSHSLSFEHGSNESYLTTQWLFFQASGQGPYYGQASHFKKYHSEVLPSAVERYMKEIKRVTGVLEDFLSKQKVRDDGDGPWLVGGRISYADLAFLPWQITAQRSLAKEKLNPEEYPKVTEWMMRMQSRESVKKVHEAVLAANR